MLTDENTFETLKRNPTNLTHEKVNDLIKLWKNKNYINESIFNSLKSSSHPLPARFYGLPKIHKPNNPLRPIVYFCGSLTYNLASCYNVISKNITPPISRVKNSFDFIEKVKNTKMLLDYKIISLDFV